MEAKFFAQLEGKYILKRDDISNLNLRAYMENVPWYQMNNENHEI